MTLQHNQRVSTTSLNKHKRKPEEDIVAEK
jgi:hypothetical protein